VDVALYDIYICVCVCIHIYIYIYTHILRSPLCCSRCCSIYRYIYIYTHIYIYIYMYTYIHIYIYICTHTHIALISPVCSFLPQVLLNLQAANFLRFELSDVALYVRVRHSPTAAELRTLSVLLCERMHRIDEIQLAKLNACASLLWSLAGGEPIDHKVCKCIITHTHTHREREREREREIQLAKLNACASLLWSLAGGEPIDNKVCVYV